MKYIMYIVIQKSKNLKKIIVTKNCKKYIFLKMKFWNDLWQCKEIFLIIFLLLVTSINYLDFRWSINFVMTAMEIAYLKWYLNFRRLGFSEIMSFFIFNESPCTYYSLVWGQVNVLSRHMMQFIESVNESKIIPLKNTQHYKYASTYCIYIQLQ